MQLKLYHEESRRRRDSDLPRIDDDWKGSFFFSLSSPLLLFLSFLLSSRLPLTHPLSDFAHLQTMDVLPAIGTIYSSLAAFKLDILERGGELPVPFLFPPFGTLPTVYRAQADSFRSLERLGITYVVRLSKSYLLWLQCNVVLGESPCGHSIQAKKLVSEEGEVKVVTTRGDHTWSQSQLEANFRNPVMLKNREARLKAAKSEVIGTVDEVQEPEMEIKMEDVESTIGRRRISAQIAARKLNTAAREEELEDEEMEEREYEVQDGNEYEPENDEMEERQVGKSGQFSSTEVLRIRAAQLLQVSSS